MPQTSIQREITGGKRTRSPEYERRNGNSATPNAFNKLSSDKESELQTFTIEINKMYELIPFISFEYPYIERKIDLMIDSGSQGNVIKSDALPYSVKLNHNERIWIQGISDDPFITIGTVNIKLFNQTIKFDVI